MNQIICQALLDVILVVTAVWCAPYFMADLKSWF